MIKQRLEPLHYNVVMLSKFTQQTSIWCHWSTCWSRSHPSISHTSRAVTPDSIAGLHIKTLPRRASCVVARKGPLAVVRLVKWKIAMTSNVTQPENKLFTVSLKLFLLSPVRLSNRADKKNLSGRVQHCFIWHNVIIQNSAPFKQSFVIQPWPELVLWRFWKTNSE